MSVVDDQRGLVMVEGGRESGAPPAISRLLLSMARAMEISRLVLVGWLDLELDYTRSSAWRFGGKAHHDAIPRDDPAACYHDAHDPGLAHHLAVAIASKNSVEQTRLKSID